MAPYEARTSGSLRPRFDILTGASKIRVNSIRDSLGRILNVRDMPPDFFQRLLTRPAVIEMGALGDPSSIALVMAFLVTQLAGHIEFAHAQGKRKEKPHLLLIEEAHRLLSAEAAATASPNQGNVRGKSAEELNNLLAEVRKFRQGIMVLDQRPSSLVGGVLDNALINIMCRLNDRVGFEHLSNVLNLSPAQQRFARTRLQAGDALLLDAVSGQPILTRAPNVVDELRARYNQLPSADLWRQLRANAERVGLLSPSVAATEPWLGATRVPEASMDRLSLDPLVDDRLLEQIKPLLDRRDWRSIRSVIRASLSQNRPALEQALFAHIITRLTRNDATELLTAFATGGDLK